MRRVPVLLLVLALAACGGSSKHAATTPATTTTTAAGGPPVEVLYQSGGWRIVRPRQTPVVQRLVGSTWKRVSSGTVRISILSPKPNSTTAPIPQVAAEFDAKVPIIEAGIWLDGVELPVRGGGTPTRHTFYGAPASNLPAGKQAVIAYARTAKGGVAVKWFFRVR